MSNGYNGYQSDLNQGSPTILQRIAHGDSFAAEECFNTYEKLIWTFSRKFTNNLADAEDLVQEIFIDIWKSAADFDAAKSPEWAFIRLIAKRRLWDYLRKHYRSPQIISSEELREEGINNSHLQLQRQLESELVIIALNQLRPADRQIIKMSVFEGLSHEEIAQKICLPLGTIKTRIRRGIQKMRTSLRFSKKIPIGKM